MQRLKWFLIGIALTSFASDYISMKVGWLHMESIALRSTLAADRAQVNSTACLVELAYNKSIIESWVEKRRLTTLAQTEILQTLDRAREGDREAISDLASLGYTISKANNRLVASLPPTSRGMGGF